MLEYPWLTAHSQYLIQLRRAEAEHKRLLRLVPRRHATPWPRLGAALLVLPALLRAHTTPIAARRRENPR